MHSFRHQNQPGFTLVELVVVIVLIGILAAIAIPKFYGMTADAQAAATQGMAAVLGSASANNFSVRTAFPTKGAAVANCTTIGDPTVLAGGLPTGYVITDAAITAGSTASCTVTGAGGTTALFTGHGIV